MKKEKEAFAKIKEVIVVTPALFNLDFNRELMLYTFSSNWLLATVLTQKDEQGNEHPISFMSTGMQGSELNYLDINKKGYVVYK